MKEGDSLRHLRKHGCYLKREGRALRATLPRWHWTPLNDLLVTFGQNCCKPLSPLCSRCPIAAHCPRVGVTHSR